MSLNQRFLALSLIALVAILVRLPLFWGGFIDFDDGVLLYENEVMTWLDRDNFWVAASNFRGERQSLMYVVSQLNWAASGGHYLGFLVPNLLWYAATSAIVYAFSGLFLRDVRSRLGAALLFAVHGMNTDMVAWVSARGHLLGLPFALLAMTAWGHRSREGWGLKWGVVAALCLAVAMYAKLVFIGVPVAFLVIDHLQGRRWLDPRAWPARLLPFAFVWLAIPGTDSRSSPDISDAQRFYARVAGLMEYLVGVYAPVATSPITWNAPGRTLLDTGGGGMYLSGLPPLLHLILLGACGIALLWAYRRGHRTPLVLAVIALIFIAPSMLSRAVVPGVAVAYRYAYGASVCGVVLLFAVLEAQWQGWSSRARSWALVAVGLLVLAHGGRSVAQSLTWLTPTGVYENCAAHFDATWVCDLRVRRHSVMRTGDASRDLDLIEAAWERRNRLEGRGRQLDVAWVMALGLRGKPDEALWLERSVNEDELEPARRQDIQERLDRLRKAFPKR